MTNPTGKGGFVPGKSGNSAGRPKEDPLIKQMFSDLIPEAIAAVKKALKDERLYLKAAEVIFDRALGKPIQGHQLNDADGQPITPVLNLTLKTK